MKLITLVLFAIATQVSYSLWIESDKVWNDSQCANIGSYRGTLQQCQSECEKKADCTALNFAQSVQICYFRRCGNDVPQPKWTVNGFKGYYTSDTAAPTPSPTAAPTPVLPIITDVKSCWCKEDPHCVGFADSELFHLPRIGDFRFYKNSNIEIRTRQEQPTNRPPVIVITGVVFKGKWTCDQKIEITRGAWGTYKNSNERDDYKKSYQPVLAVDGAKTEGAGNIISKLTSLFGSCNFISFSVRSGYQRTLDFKFPDNTRLAIQKWMYFPGFGTTVALNLDSKHYDKAADTGVCVSKDSQTSACSENMFTQFNSCVE